MKIKHDADPSTNQIRHGSLAGGTKYTTHDSGGAVDIDDVVANIPRASTEMPKRESNPGKKP